MERPNPQLLPTTHGIYIYKDALGHILYVGKARVLRNRLLSYFRADDQLTAKTAALMKRVVSLETISTGTEKEALLLEASLIKKYRPRYNIVLRDDKQYILFRISNKHPFPRLEITRKARKLDAQGKAKKENARYFGPFTSGYAAREAWKSIHKIFPLRRCADSAFRNRVRPCLYHHLGLCLAPCSGNVPQEEYEAILHKVALLLAGKSRELMDILREHMEQAAEALEFEKAASYRDQITAVEKTIEKQGVVSQDLTDKDVFGLATRPDGLALGLLFVRQGVLLDKRAYFWPGLSLEDADELLLSFIPQFYGPLSFIPPHIILPWLPQGGDAEPENYADIRAEAGTETNVQASVVLGAETVADAGAVARHDEENIAEENPTEALQTLLADIRGGAVSIRCPRNAEERSLVDMAKENAIENARTKVEKPLAERLALVLRLKEPVNRIECVDVSHTGGQDTKVGVVVFEEGKPLKEDYRVWNIDGADGDDYAALSKWAVRRIEHGAPWPDLFLIDGGKGQLAAVEKVFQQHFGIAFVDALPENAIAVQAAHKSNIQPDILPNAPDAAIIPSSPEPVEAVRIGLFQTWGQHKMYVQADIKADSTADMADMADIDAVADFAVQALPEQSLPEQDLPDQNADEDVTPAASRPFSLAAITKARDEDGKADRRAGNIADRIFVPGRSNPLAIREGSAELLFLQRVRDAAHDFSIGRHRAARTKRALSAELTRLEGVGEHTARLLWDSFDSLEAMKSATAEAIGAVQGIGPKRGKKIWQSLQKL